MFLAVDGSVYAESRQTQPVVPALSSDVEHGGAGIHRSVAFAVSDGFLFFFHMTLT